MDRKAEYTERLLRVCSADQEFQSVWRRFRPYHRVAEAYSLTHESYYAREKAVSDLFEPLLALHDAFLRGEAAAIDEVLDFLEIDIPAFRAGYAKEWYYRRLKRLSLSQNQRVRIRDLGVSLLTQPGYRREWADLARLLTTLADEDLVIRLTRLVTSGADAFVRRRASLVLERILNQRHEFRQTAKDHLQAQD